MRSIGMAAAAIVVIAQPAFADAKRSNARPARIVHPEQWLGADHYPPAALRAGEQGRVIADVEIDASGRPVGCRVRNPGPLPNLESGTCRAVMSGGQFMAALDRKGRAVASVFTLPVRWQLPVMPLSGPVMARQVLEDVATIFSYARDNRLTSCGMKLNGDSITLPPAECGGLMTFDVSTLRQKLALTGPFRVGLSASTRQAASPPPLPGALLEGREVAFIESRQRVDAAGHAGPCTIQMSGELTGEASAERSDDLCVNDPNLQRLRRSAEKGRARHLLSVMRLILLPSAN